MEETLYEKSERLRHYGWGKLNLLAWLSSYMLFKYLEWPGGQAPVLSGPEQGWLMLLYILVGAMWSFGWGYYYYRKAR